MKKVSLLLVAVATSISSVFAGGLLTNTNQSVQFVRMGSRNASTEIDATYFNPAGLTQLQNGWHFSLQNQTVKQTREIESTYPLLTNTKQNGVSLYEGDVNVPLFPSGFAVYKKGKSAFSLGLGINGGGGTAEYKNGLPSFESQIAQFPGLVNQLGGAIGVSASGYDSNVYFKGMSAFWGLQFNYSYEVNEAFSVGVGMRGLIANNVYEGSIGGIAINPKGASFDGSFIPAGSFIDAVQGAGLLTAEQAAAYKGMVADKTVDATQKGFGLTPILSVNIRPNDKWNISARYEFRTKLELENETKKDDVGMYPNGATSRSDVPAILAMGVDHMLCKKLKLSTSVTYYMDNGVEWGYDSRTKAERKIDNSTVDYGVGLEYSFSEKFKASAGYQYTASGVADNWRNDVTHSLSSSTFGAGFALNITERLVLDVAGMYSLYTPSTRVFTDAMVGSYTEKYDRKNMALGLGLTYRILK